MAIIDVVRFDGLKSRDWLIYKYYSEELVLGTQLIVQEGQVALFVKGGAIADIFFPRDVHAFYQQFADPEISCKPPVWRENAV